MQVKSIDEYGIIKDLRARKEKDALILITALRRALKREQELTATAIRKIREQATEILKIKTEQK